jgi:predicted dehydrogenase
MAPLRIGIVGCGNISGIYFRNLGRYEETEIIAVADLDIERAKSVAEKNGVPHVLTADQLIAHPDVDLVLNLTIPIAHATIAQQAAEAGKHVYNEKPLAIERADAQRFLATAEANGVRVGCAPDTFLGSGIQTCRKLIDEGAIGDIVGGSAFMLCRGHESWHPSPEFYYEAGGGPMLDMGPYYVTALVNLLGPIRRVSGSTRITFPTRTITSQPKSGKVIEVETPTHLVGVMDFENGAAVQIATSFDVYGSTEPTIAIYGSEGTLLCPDPNGFAGQVKLRRKGGEFESIPLAFGDDDNARGIGVRDIALAISENRPHRASGALAYHVLDVMKSFQESSESNQHITLSSGVPRPAPIDPVEAA